MRGQTKILIFFTEYRCQSRVELIQKVRISVLQYTLIYIVVFVWK